MRVCHIITGLNDGGAEGVLYRLCLNGGAVEPHVISLMDEGKYGAALRSSGVRVHSLNMRRGRVTLSGLASLRRLLLTIKPDVVQTWMYHADLIGGLMARSAGLKNVVWGLRHSDFGHGTSRSTRFVVRACAAVSPIVPRRIVSCSQRGVRPHREAGYDVSKMVVVPNGYDIQLFSPDEKARADLRGELGVREDEFLVGMVARWHPQKDHATLISALCALKQHQGTKWRCVLVGTGIDSQNEQLGGLIASLGLQENVSLLGRRTDIPRLMNALDLHVLSSAHGEGFPNVVAEAMACGTPCVVTDVGDAGLIVGDAGWVAQPRAAAEIAECIGNAMEEFSDAARWRLLKSECRRRVAQNFSVEKMVERFAAVWQGATPVECLVDGT